MLKVVEPIPAMYDECCGNAIQCLPGALCHSVSGMLYIGAIYAWFVEICMDFESVGPIALWRFRRWTSSNIVLVDAFSSGTHGNSLGETWNAVV